MRDFNVDIQKNKNHGKNKQELLNFMDKFKLGFHESTTKVGFQLDQIWANVFENECKYGVIETYWPNLHNRFILHSNY
jgi:hypothetical protein